MTLQHFRDSLPIAGIAVIVLLTVQSCEEKAKTDTPSLQTATNPHLIDSLLRVCKATFDSARKDHSRKDILVRGQQLMQQTEKLAEAVQYKLDTLAKVVELEAHVTLEFGDSAMGRKRKAYARGIYSRTENKKGLANAYRTTSSFFTAEKDSAEMIAVLDSAAHISLAAQDTLNYFNTALTKANLYFDLNLHDKYLQTMLNLLEFQRSKFRINISPIAFAIAGEYSRAHNDTTAFKYYLEAVENLHNDSNRTYHHAAYYEQLGFMYYDMINFREARKSFDKALELASEPGNENADKASMAISWIESCYMAEHKYQEGIDHMKQLIPKYPPANDDGKVLLAHNMLELYMLNGQYAEAGRYADELLGYDRQGRIIRAYQQFTYELIGKLNMYRGRLDDARVSLVKAYEHAKQDSDLRSMAEDSKQLFKIDSANGRYLDAIRWFNEYRTNTDTRRSRTHLKELRELNIKYATEKRVDSLQTLTKQTVLQHSLLEQRGFVRNLFIAIAILLVLILAILFGRYRLKQRVNKKLEENQQKINQQNKALEQLIADERKLVLEKSQLLIEKEWLLKEVHHRVKNNLQIMMNLLELQSEHLQNDALLAMEDGRRRIYAMSLIHQKLYQSDDISIVDMELYMREFVTYLKDSFDISNRVHFIFNLEPVELSVTQAIPIALIANEAITNSFKYAFPGDRRGVITISLTEANDEVEIQLADNGIGMPENVLTDEGTSLGMKLMKGLTDEINGTILFDITEGTKVIIRFKRTVIWEMQVGEMEG
jgi:two-component sensor histidine kinase